MVGWEGLKNPSPSEKESGKRQTPQVKGGGFQSLETVCMD